jgi:hypothetical protein
MLSLSLRPRISLLLTLSAIALGCGSGRELQSVTVTPAAADARNFPSGQVSFSATGTFSKPPSPQPLTSNDVAWCVGVTKGACAGNINPGATVDQNGVTQCVPNFSGTAVIMAGKAKPSMMPDGGSQMTVYGSAQLTCP